MMSRNSSISEVWQSMEERTTATREETRARTGEGPHTKDRAGTSAGPIDRRARRHIDMVRERDYEPLPSFAFPGDSDPLAPLRDDRKLESSSLEIPTQNSRVSLLSTPTGTSQFFEDWIREVFASNGRQRVLITSDGRILEGPSLGDYLRQANGKV